LLRGDGTLNEVVKRLGHKRERPPRAVALCPAHGEYPGERMNLPWDIPGAAKHLLNADVHEIALACEAAGSNGEGAVFPQRLGLRPME